MLNETSHTCSNALETVYVWESYVAVLPGAVSRGRPTWLGVWVCYQSAVAKCGRGILASALASGDPTA